MTGWDGKSVKDHVEEVQNVAGGADALARENSSKAEELDSRVADLERNAEQPRAANTVSFMDQMETIDSDFGALAKLIEAAASHVSKTYSDNELNALSGEAELRRYIKNTGTSMAAMLLAIADDIRAQAKTEKSKVCHG